MGTITRTFANNISTGGKFDATQMTGTLPASTIADASVTNISDVPALVATTTVSSDPGSPDNGQIWYNTTDRRLKAYVLSTGSWSSGGNLNTGRYAQGLGSQTAAHCVSGGGAPGITAFVEQYNGSAWTEIGDVNTGRAYGAAKGTTSAGLYSGGGPSSGVGNTEE